MATRRSRRLLVWCAAAMCGVLGGLLICDNGRLLVTNPGVFFEQTRLGMARSFLIGVRYRMTKRHQASGQWDDITTCNIANEALPIVLEQRPGPVYDPYMPVRGVICFRDDTAVILVSVGPNRRFDNIEWRDLSDSLVMKQREFIVYDPTNGAASVGDLFEIAEIRKSRE